MEFCPQIQGRVQGNTSIFMSFSTSFAKYYVGALLLGVGPPRLEILDPPLRFALICSAVCLLLHYIKLDMVVLKMTVLPPFAATRTFT